MNKKHHLCISMIGSILLSAGMAQATELVFQFTNPSFGGNPLNTFLLAKAQAQNDKKAPAKLIEKPDQLDQFADSLQRQILYRLSRDIIDKIFGEDNSLQEGIFEVGGFEIEVIEEIDGVNVRIINIETGNQTEIKLPFTP